MVSASPLSKRIFAPVFLGILLIFGVSCAPQPQLDPRATPESAGATIEKESVFAQNAMVVAAHPEAVQAGYDILQRGGSAMDAAIATQLVLNLVEPQSSGIGGGGFLVLHDPKTAQTLSYDGRETAPKSVTEKLFIKENGEKMGFFEAAVGGRAVGVPGLVALFEQAHKAHGKLAWADLFEPAIRLSENGFNVTPRLHELLEKDRFLRNEPTARAYFYQENGDPWPVGHLLKNPKFAESLRQIQRGGAASFYIGQLADKIVDKARNHPTNPGFLNLEDMAGYQAIQRDPVCMTYQAHKICGMAPPSSGGLGVLQILGIMEQYEQNNSADEQKFMPHILAEASKLAFADRNFFVADPDFFPVPQKGMLNSAYLIGRSTLIQDDSVLSTPVAPGGPFLYSETLAPHEIDHGISTTHLSIIDQDGMAISLTTSIENAFGSRQMVGGFLLNNQLTDFSFFPDKDGVKIANRVQPDKRPRSSMAPTIVLDAQTNKPVMIVGSPGGSRIIGYVAKTIHDVLTRGMSLKASLEEGHLTNRNGSTDLETGRAILSHQTQLEQLGHTVKTRAMTSGIHVIRLTETGLIEGAADPRREGKPKGY